MNSGETLKSLYGFEFREFDKRRERLNEDGSRRFDIKQLWQRSHEIINLALLGHKQVEIAKMLDIHPQTVSNTLNGTLGTEVLSDKRKERDEEYEELHDEVMELTRKSLAVYNQILDSETEGMKLKKETADTVVLELSGIRVPTRIDSRSVSMSLTPDEIAEFKRRGIEAARKAGKLAVVEGEDNG